ncbi:MAG: STAS domain-containing protein [Planctomycetota bacterium]|jgi:anti-sigma B factor antagonist
MPKLKISSEEIQSPKHRRATHTVLDGVISTPTMHLFRECLKYPMDSGLDLVLDLQGVNYINSTGLGEMLRADEHLEMHSCHLILVNVNPDVEQLITILGLSRILHIYPTVEDGLNALDATINHEEHELPPIEEDRPRRKKVRFTPPSKLPPARLPEANIILGLKEENHFTRFVQRCLSGKVESARIASTRKEFSDILSSTQVDVAILDTELPEYDEICALLKTQPSEGLTSIISIYSEGMEDLREADFRIREDDHVIEPFEVREIVALIEREFIRCHEQGILFNQDINLTFNSSDDAIGRSIDTLETMLASADMETTARDAYLYALREGIDNARRHGNKGDASKQIEVMYILDREKITTHITDQGEGFDATQFINRSRKLSPVEQARERHKIGEHGGLGINLMLRCCDEVEYILPGNTLKLTKYL